MVPELSDEALLDAYRNGDAGAFEALFRRYQARLCSYLERVVGDRGAAEDIVIETFQRVHAHRSAFRSGAAVRPWLYTIARNLARNRRRRERVIRWLGLETVDREAALRQPSPEPGRDSEIQHRVTQAFAVLPVAQRDVCALRLLGGLSLAEIATITRASLGTVKSRLFYGQRRLRQLLADLHPGHATAATAVAVEEIKTRR